jgi:putative acetyltransferase
MDIEQATSPDQMRIVAGLFTEYSEWVMHNEDIDPEFVKRVFTYQGLQEELVHLPGEYAPPEGRILLAVVDGKIAGCVALKQIGKDICEMKRMWVRPDFRGRGIGRALANAIIDEARRIGYTKMFLDTGKFMKVAPTLYRSLGFQYTKPYYEIPRDMTEVIDFMELDLK